ncbi:MAG: S-adenosylmethionine:tRNA ribosyltransferase-isomerase, partial [Chloroflexota bacterium]
TLESIYWLGVKLINKTVDKNSGLSLQQWEAYEINTEIPVNEALNALKKYMEEKNTLSLYASTSIMIVPGYNFRITKGIITNFHQPRSTLLLLVSAWIGERWKDAYKFAIENDFRFLSYGDSSLLLP